MSSQKGNVLKRGPPKHQNKSAFKNDLHDRTPQMKMINSLVLDGICRKCKEVIDWKIKYKKYKPLTVPKKCTKCQQKTVRQAYYIMCVQCASRSNVCAKCGQKSESVTPSSMSKAEQMSQDSQLQTELEMLPERKRRQFFRLQEEGKLNKDAIAGIDKSLLREDDDDDDDDDEVVSDSEDDDVELPCKNSSNNSDREIKSSNGVCCSGLPATEAEKSVTCTGQKGESESADRKSGTNKETDIMSEVQNISIESQKDEVPSLENISIESQKDEVPSLSDTIINLKT